MLRSHIARLVPVALTLFGFGTGVPRASAQTIFSFNANYNAVNHATFISLDVLQVSISGESIDAPYGLSKVEGLTYGKVDLAADSFTFNTDPKTFGLRGQPQGLIKLLGSNGDSLFGTHSLIGFTDFQNFTVTATGTLTLTGGEGRFKGATGKLDLFELDALDPNFDLTKPIKGNVRVSGSFQTVPEPKADMALVGMGIIGVGVLLCRRKRRSTFG